MASVDARAASFLGSAACAGAGAFLPFFLPFFPFLEERDEEVSGRIAATSPVSVSGLGSGVGAGSGSAAGASSGSAGVATTASIMATVSPARDFTSGSGASPAASLGSPTGAAGVSTGLGLAWGAASGLSTRTPVKISVFFPSSSAGTPDRSSAAASPAGASGSGAGATTTRAWTTSSSVIRASRARSGWRSPRRAWICSINSDTLAKRPATVFWSRRSIKEPSVFTFGKRGLMRCMGSGFSWICRRTIVSTLWELKGCLRAMASYKSTPRE